MILANHIPPIKYRDPIKKRNQITSACLKEKKTIDNYEHEIILRTNIYALGMWWSTLSRVKSNLRASSRPTMLDMVPIFLLLYFWYGAA